MAFMTIPTRVALQDLNSAADINQLMANDTYLKTIQDDLVTRMDTAENNIVELLANYDKYIILASDVVNNEAIANTLKDTGLQFSILANELWAFEMFGVYDAAATTTGSRWVISGTYTPAMIGYVSEYSLTSTTQTLNYANAFNIPSACNEWSAYPTGNVVWIGGIIKAGANNDTIKVRFASEVASSAITLKAGSYIKVKKLG